MLQLQAIHIHLCKRSFTFKVHDSSKYPSANNIHYQLTMITMSFHVKLSLVFSRNVVICAQGQCEVLSLISFIKLFKVPQELPCLACNIFSSSTKQIAEMRFDVESMPKQHKKIFHCKRCTFLYFPDSFSSKKWDVFDNERSTWLGSGFTFSFYVL